MHLSPTEIEIREAGMTFSGTDEAGRGCLAGPVVAASVILHPSVTEIEGLNDSKKLSEKKRYDLVPLIRDSSIAVEFGLIENSVVDDINILRATMQAMHRSIEKLDPRPDRLLIDGNYFVPCGIPHRTVVGGDGICLSIAAASVIAKTVRDLVMIEFDTMFPGYGFARNKGYGTKEHTEAIKKIGPCPLHRMTFLKKLQANSDTLFK